MTGDASGLFRLPPSRSAPATARQAVRDVADSLVSPEVADCAELLASELVTNAVMHGTGTVTLEILCADNGLDVSVGDEDPSTPVVQPDRPMSLGGRGLRMVELLAAEWGVRARADGPGKVVWFRVH